MVVTAVTNCRQFGENQAESWRSGTGRWTAEIADQLHAEVRATGQNCVIKRERKWSQLQLCSSRTNKCQEE